MELDTELRQNILDLLYIIQYLDSEQLYESQDYYTALLPLIFDSNFREKINDLRARLNIPHEWYRKMRDDVGAAWEDWLDINPQAPKEPTHSVIINLAFELGLDAIRYGMFLLDYLYFSSIDIENSSPFKEEFLGKVKLIFSPNGHNNPGLYIQIFQDTNPTSLNQFIIKNKETIRNLQKSLERYPVNRVRTPYIFKRDLEVFLLDSLDFKASQIQDILDGEIKDKLLTKFEKENEEYISDLPLLISYSNFINIIKSREKKEIYRHISETDIRTIVSNFKKDFHIPPKTIK